jgi:uncharacterized protein (TIGR02466 family)
MPEIRSLFPTFIYRAPQAGSARLNRELKVAAHSLVESDREGQRWCTEHGYPGYTSYGSMANLADHMPVFARLARVIERHATAFAKALHWELRGGKPTVDTMWVNVLPEGGSHSSHLHTNAVLSGTYYVTTPEGSGPIVFEDPRHAMMMAAPPRRKAAPGDMQTYVSEKAEPGTLLLWESWLRHEVPLNRASGERISVSFNCVVA